VPTMAWRNPPTRQMAGLCTSCTVSKNIYHRTERQYPSTYIDIMAIYFHGRFFFYSDAVGRIPPHTFVV